ncbi:M50 family metallopeptidase [Yoonia litorea]|uniref:Peptidase M50B-like n=1 Tax=Yoonia litorea TaxID=1123755 RepID=A0A1I6L3Q7_9RHOB|nr:M50 family metallopeptidase [Yoonia litorea]SFR98113.1 Peptidase M50B-like [Yoonia litorea]
MRLIARHWQLLVLTGLVFLFWQTPVLAPLKILIVFFHEAAHAVATILTGGEVVSLSVSADQGGFVLSRGGNRFLILNAGYLGSLVIGIGLLLAASKSAADKAIMAALGVLMLVIGGLYVRDAFALVFTIGVGVMMLLSARFLAHAANDLILRVIGLTSMIYVPFDIFSDTILRSSLNSDARMLATEFGGTAQLWGTVWIVASLGVIFWAIKRLIGSRSNVQIR